MRKSISPNKLYSVQSRFLVPPSSAHFRKEADYCAALSECSSVRSLDFSSAEQHKERESSKVEPSDSSKESSTSNKTGGSWADRVKGVSSQQPVSIASSSSIAPQLSTEQEKVSPTTAASLGDSNEGGEVPKTLADSGDWEKVMRHRPRHGNHVERGDTIQLSPVPVRRNKDSHKSQVESSSCSLCEEDVGDQSSSGNNQQDTKKLNQVLCVYVGAFMFSSLFASLRKKAGKLLYKNRKIERNSLSWWLGLIALTRLLPWAYLRVVRQGAEESRYTRSSPLL